MNANVLFVHDEAPVRDMVALHLRKHGYSVLTATCMEEAHQIMRSANVQLNIFDAELAGHRSMALLSYSKVKSPELQVIFYTEKMGDDRQREEAMRRGADGWMSRTQSLEELVGEVRRLLPAPL